MNPAGNSGKAILLVEVQPNNDCVTWLSEDTRQNIEAMALAIRANVAHLIKSGMSEKEVKDLMGRAFDTAYRHGLKAARNSIKENNHERE